MKYSAEYAVFHAAFQLFERQVLSADLDLKSLSKKDCQRFTHIISGAVAEICHGLQEKHCLFSNQHWNSNLHLILFLKLFSQESLQNTTEKLYEKINCKDDLLVIVAPLPHLPRAFYFELLKTCSWNSIFIECLSVLKPEEIKKFMVHAIQHCQEPPVSADDLLLLTAMIRMINETCLPKEIQEFWPRHKEARISTNTSLPHSNLISVRNMLCDHNEILLDLLNGMEQLLISATEEVETSDLSFWNGHELSHFDDIFFGLTLLGIAVYGDSFDIRVTLNDLLTTEGLCDLDTGQLSNLTQNMKKWQDKGEDIESLRDLHLSATKFSALKNRPCHFSVEHLKSLDSKYIEKIISNLYLYFKCRNSSIEDGIIRDQKSLSASKFCSLCEMFISKSHLLLLKKEASSDNDGAENGDCTEKGDCAEKGDSTTKGDSTEKRDGAEKSDCSENGDSTEKGDGAEKGDSTEKRDSTETRDSTENGDGAAKSDCSENGDGAEKGDSTEKDFTDEIDLILEQLKRCCIISSNNVLEDPSLEENILPEDKLAELLKDENVNSWKDESFLTFLQGHLRELSNPDLFHSLWERVNWLNNVTEEDKNLMEKYLKVLLDAFTLLDPLLQDYLIHDFHLPIKCKTDRPWWRQSARFQQQLAVSLNKLTERNISKIPGRISQYALLDIETVLRTSVFTAVNNACQVDVIVQLLTFLPISCQIPSPCNNPDDKESKDMKRPSLLGSVLESVLNSGKLDKSQQNAFLDLVTQLIKFMLVHLKSAFNHYLWLRCTIWDQKMNRATDFLKFIFDTPSQSINEQPVSTGVRKQFGVTKYLISFTEVFDVHILPRLHLCLTLDANQPSPVFILQLLLIVLESEQIQQSSCIEGFHLHVILLQICHALNTSIESWKEVNKREVYSTMKPLLISTVSLLEEIILKKLPPQPDKVFKWLYRKLSVLDWTVQLRLRKLLFLKHQNSEQNLQFNNEIVTSFLKTLEITNTCDLQQTIHLLRLASIDEELCTCLMHCLPSYILFSRDCVTVAVSQLLPNFLPAEGILVCRFLMHLLQNNQLIVPCHTGFLPSIPCIDLSVLKSSLGILQLFLDVTVLQDGLERAIGQCVFDNIFVLTKDVLLAPAVLSKISPMLTLLLIHQIFSVMNLLLNISDYLNADKILLFLVELITIFNQHFSMFHPIPKKKKRGNTKIEESEIPGANTLEFNLNEAMIAEVIPEDASSEGVSISPPDKFHIALTLELLSSMSDQVNHISNCEIKNSILMKLDEMKQPFLKVCRKIK